MFETTEKLAKELLSSLFPICRSLTGDGNRSTLKRLAEVIPLDLIEIPSGGDCYDWKVPEEWNIRDAWIKDESGNKVVDFKDSNLHVVGYSTPIKTKLSFKDLEGHLHTLPNIPDAIPYRTSYYNKSWGFCLSHKRFLEMDRRATYEVCIESEFNPSGSLTLGHCIKAGRSGKTYIISTYCCHPSLANDNLSGVVLSVLLFKWLMEMDTYHSYRLIVAPETIGVIAYLQKFENEMKEAEGGFVVTTVAGPGPIGYKNSFLNDHVVDRVARRALRGIQYIEYPFKPDGSDERQYSSPGFRLPTGTITKDKYYEYQQYHTSHDNLDFISSENLCQVLELYMEAIRGLEMNRFYRRTTPHCEYQLGKYGLYPGMGGAVSQPGFLGGKDHTSHDYSINQEEQSTGTQLDAMGWLMHLCDGSHSLLDIADQACQELEDIYQAARKMEESGLLKEAQFS